MKQVVAFSLLGLLLTGTAQAGEFALSYGAGNDKLSFVNAYSVPKQEEPVPLGPLSFRVLGDETWVADSVASRILKIGANGKVAATILVPDVATNTLLEDFALTRGPDGRPDGIWVISAQEQDIIRLTLDGKETARIGGRGNTPGKFIQASRLEIGESGRLYIVDKGRQKVVVLEPDGKLVREQDWQWSGLCLDGQENLYLTTWDARASKLHLQVFDLEGKMARDLPLDLPAHTDPEVWYCNPAGQVLLAFTPASGFRGKLKMALIETSGQVAEIADLPIPIAMNRYLEPADQESFWLVAANYAKAPRGEFRVRRFPLPGKS